MAAVVRNRSVEELDLLRSFRGDDRSAALLDPCATRMRRLASDVGSRPAAAKSVGALVRGRLVISQT
jgi:hypothetical protein